MEATFPKNRQQGRTPAILATISGSGDEDKHPIGLTSKGKGVAERKTVSISIEHQAAFASSCSPESDSSAGFSSTICFRS